MKRVWSVLLLGIFALFVLSGCVTFKGGTPDDRPIVSQYDDAGIKTAIATSLLKKSPSKANKVNVNCYKGHVFLVGEADNDFRLYALETAREIKGVVHVTTHWFPDGTGNSLNDAKLGNAIAQRLAFAQSAQNSQVDVDVWDGHVVLTGLVSKQSLIDRAIAETKKVVGVKSVTSYLAPLSSVK